MIPLILAALVAAAPVAPDAVDRTTAIHQAIMDPDGRTIVVAHRGCHAAAPAHALPGAPENSLAALDQCVALGVDVMETDVRRSRDGVLVMIHDATLDRTTDGSGPVASLTLADLRKLRLRADLGGADAAPTDQRIVTLDEMLARAKGRIILNLDIKEAIYPEVIDAVIRAGARDRVIVKTTASVATAPLASIAPYDRVPFMPILRFPADERQLIEVMQTQLSGTRPIGFELPPLTPAVLPALAAIARQNRVRLWINTLGDGYVAGIGGDPEAVRDPSSVWGRLQALGISMFQTDNPEALIAFLRRR
jgi:glycerophosphoryl diester phosphodiesterase